MVPLNSTGGVRCLRCGLDLVSGGGLRRCRDCGWVEHRPAD
ncbi:hypothetical protein [Halospeciosus flavus]